jgi:hypothetical protein
MTQKRETRRAGGAAGLCKSSLLAGFDDEKNKQSHPKNQAACPIVIAANCRMTADLLAESIELAIDHGINILSATRERGKGKL